MYNLIGAADILASFMRPLYSDETHARVQHARLQFTLQTGGSIHLSWKHDSSTVLLVVHMKSSMMLHYTDLPWLSHVKAAQKYVELPVTVTDNLPGTFLPTSEWLTLPLVFVYHPLIPPIFSYPPLWGINQPHKHLNTFSDHSSLRISPQIIEPWLCYPWYHTSYQSTHHFLGLELSLSSLPPPKFLLR